MMRLSTSTCIYFNRPDGSKASIIDCVRACAQAGYRVMDMNFHDCAVFKTPLWDDDWESWVHRIKETADLHSVEFSQAHSHFYNYCDSLVLHKDVLDEKIRRGIVGSGILGVKWLVIHAATDWNSATLVKSSKAKALEYFKPIIDLAAEHQVGLAIENLWELNISPLRRYTTTSEELVDLVDSLGSGRVGICWDFEHADIMRQNQKLALQLVGPRLKATHVSDSTSKTHDHVLPFEGNTNWDEVMDALSSIDYDGDFCFEIHRYTMNTPDALIPSALKHSVEVGNYLLGLHRQPNHGFSQEPNQEIIR